MCVATCKAVLAAGWLCRAVWSLPVLDSGDRRCRQCPAVTAHMVTDTQSPLVSLRGFGYLCKGRGQTPGSLGRRLRALEGGTSAAALVSPHPCPCLHTYWRLCPAACSVEGGSLAGGCHRNPPLCSGEPWLCLYLSSCETSRLLPGFC